MGECIVTTMSLLGISIGLRQKANICTVSVNMEFHNAPCDKTIIIHNFGLSLTPSIVHMYSTYHIRCVGVWIKTSRKTLHSRCSLGFFQVSVCITRDVFVLVNVKPVARISSHWALVHNWTDIQIHGVTYIHLHSNLSSGTTCTFL